VAKVIHSILIDVVKDGTAKLARFMDLRFGGKTGNLAMLAGEWEVYD